MLIWTLVGCKEPVKEQAVGNPDEIVIYAANKESEKFKDEFIGRLEQKWTYSNHEEKVFDVIWIDGGTKEGKEKFHKEGYCNRKNVILLGSLLSRTDVETTIKKKLPKENLPKAFQGETYIFQIGDLWALNQHSIIIAANSKDALEYEAVMPNAEKIRKMYTDSLNTIVESYLFENEVTEQFMPEIKQKYGWFVRLPVQFDKKGEKEFRKGKAGVVWFEKRVGGTSPHLKLAVYWEDVADMDVDKTYWFKTRDKIFGEIYEGDKIDMTEGVEPQVSKSLYLDRKGLRIQGTWLDDENNVGGPYRAYALWSPEDQRMYYIDFAVYGPEVKKKEKYMREFEIMFKTFLTKNPPPKEEDEG